MAYPMLTSENSHQYEFVSFNDFLWLFFYLFLYFLICKIVVDFQSSYNFSFGNTFTGLDTRM